MDDVRALASNVGRCSVLLAIVHSNSVDGVEAKEMTKQEFWEMLVDNMTDYECEVICPVKKYHMENKKPLLCDLLGDCAAALRELALRLECKSNDD